jgi:hypothetical protein
MPGYKFGTILVALAVTCSIFAVPAYARQGDSGYEGGISSGEAPGKTSFDYKEVCFITGEPIVLSGTLTIKRSIKQDRTTGKDIETSNYTYRLDNLEKGATLTRFLSYNTIITKKDNGQTIEETSINTNNTEVVRLGNITYTLRNYDFTKSNITDSKPAVDYFAGNLWGRKTYQAGAGTNTGTVTVEMTGDFYGYNQFWGTTETRLLRYIIESESNNNGKIDKWGGTVDISLSSTTSKQIKYVENEPETISFEGGFVQNQYNSSVMQYISRLPEFDSQGVSTDRLMEMKGSLEIESFPVNTRLPVPDLIHIRGHWAENDIKALYSLEVLKEDAKTFNPQEIMKRAEFADAIVLAAKEVPKDSLTATAKTSRTVNKKAEEIISPFLDVSTESKYFENINNAYKRGMISGRGEARFAPDDYLSTADAVTIIIRALGLEGLAPDGGIATTFRDNDDIPAYAHSSVYVAQRIGLVLGDENGYFKPQEHLTKARAAVIINKLINYMRNDLKKDYRERVINYR